MQNDENDSFMQHCEALILFLWIWREYWPEQPEEQCLFAEVRFGKVLGRKCSASVSGHLLTSVKRWLKLLTTSEGAHWKPIGIFALKLAKMPRGATQRRVLGVRRSYSSEDEPEPRLSEVAGPNQDQGPVEPVDVQLRTGRGLWWSVGLSVLGSAAAVTAAGCFCALTYPILKGMRASRVG